MRLQIPAIVAAYLSAEVDKDASGVALCFAEDATVSDERNVYRVRQAILEWQQKSYKHTAMLSNHSMGPPMRTEYEYMLV